MPEATTAEPKPTLRELPQPEIKRNWHQLKTGLLKAMVKSSEFQEGLVDQLSRERSMGVGTNAGDVKFVKDGRNYEFSIHAGSITLNVLHEGVKRQDVPAGPDALDFMDTYHLYEPWREDVQGWHIETQVDGDHQQDNQVAIDRFNALMSDFKTPGSPPAPASS